jgi:hypothetical protein
MGRVSVSWQRLLTEALQRRPHHFLNLVVGLQRWIALNGKHVGRDAHVQRASSGHGALMIQRAQILRAGEIQADLLQGFALCGRAQVGIARAPDARRETPCGRTRDRRVSPPADEQQFGVVSARARRMTATAA